MPFMIPIAWGGTLTAGQAGAAAAIASAGVAGYSAISSANAAKDQAKTRKDLAEYDAKVKKMERDNIRAGGAFRSQQRRDKTRKLLATARVNNAAAGVTSKGSPLLAQMEIAEVGEFDSLMIERNARIGAQQKEGESARYKALAKSYTQTGRNQANASLLAGAGTITNTASTYFNKA